ncbi:MAG TPA: hypothetical protein VFQ37_00820 [Mycobacterium sp.]|nr:hypothetical protein [Mycobacterium sp.]
MNYCYGLKPVRRQPSLRLVDYLRPSDLPAVESLPAKFGHDLIQPEMFLNDRIGCCAIAGSIEEVRLLNATRGVTVNFSNQSVVTNYSAITGYRPGPELTLRNAPPNPTDQGTDVHELFDYRQNTGLVDDGGNRHKVVAYAGLTPGDFGELLQALYLFETVGIGILVPDYAQTQFEAGGPWQPLPGRPNIEGGHYIPAVSRDGASVDIFTWGARIVMTDAFYEKFSNVAVVSFTEEMLTNGKTIDGFDRDKLLADLPEFNTGPVMSKRKKAA